MSLRSGNASKPQSIRWFRGPDVPKSVIRRFAREIAERFAPEKIILFGSHAYGTLHECSDVDILVIMPCRNQLDQAFKIRLAVTAPFSMDLIVRTPKNMDWRLKDGGSLHTEIMRKGKVLYEKVYARVGSQGGKRSPPRRSSRRRKRAVP
jgi:predicted nucleotidyltransferase